MNQRLSLWSNLSPSAYSVELNFLVGRQKTERKRKTVQCVQRCKQAAQHVAGMIGQVSCPLHHPQPSTCTPSTPAPTTHNSFPTYFNLEEPSNETPSFLKGHQFTSVLITLDFLQTFPVVYSECQRKCFPPWFQNVRMNVSAFVLLLTSSTCSLVQVSSNSEALSLPLYLTPTHTAPFGIRWDKTGFQIILMLWMVQTNIGFLQRELVELCMLAVRTAESSYFGTSIKHIWTTLYKYKWWLSLYTFNIYIITLW